MGKIEPEIVFVVDVKVAWPKKFSDNILKTNL